jgi:hypothetical protein
MTMGVGMILDNTVMLWADGRLGRFGKPGEVVTDDEDKIIIIGPHLALMTSGVHMVGENVVSNIRLNYHPGLTLAQIIDLVEYCLTNSWNYFTVGEGFDTSHPGVNCGLLLAGLAAGQPFVLLSRQLYRKPIPPQFETSPYQVIVNCRDTEEGLAIAREEFSRQLTDELCTGTYDNYLEAVTRVGASAIRKVAEVDDSVGGVIRCAISKRGAPFEKKVVKGV